MYGNFIAANIIAICERERLFSAATIGINRKLVQLRKFVNHRLQRAMYILLSYLRKISQTCFQLSQDIHSLKNERTNQSLPKNAKSDSSLSSILSTALDSFSTLL